VPEKTAAELAELTGGRIVGDPSRKVAGVCDLKNAQPHHLSFLGNSRYLAAARESRAGVVLVAETDPEDFLFTQIRVVSPSAAFAKAAALFAPEPIQFAPGIHPTAVVAAGAELGPGVSIQPHAVIEPGVRIGARTVIGAGSYIGHESVLGEDCLVYPRVVVRERSKIGNRVILHCGAVVGSDGFGYEFQKGCHVKIPQTGYVQIDDDAEIGANAAIDRGRFDRTWIQAGAKIDNLVQIAHNVIIGRHSIIVAQAGISGSTTLGDYVTIAGQAGIVGHIHIADQATVTAQSGVSKDVPAKTVVAGRHARPLRESLRLEALNARLPEIFERLRKLEEKADGKK
jgi:UDP-3-O-[3-hydroxymyristoyl] glucosamine N-acyltransferase